MVLSDNLGQGEREPMGHRQCVKPFACGTSVQGLIVLETLGWVAWARGQARVDPRRLAAIGNSGGGALTLFLAALCPELAVLSSSGYPSTFRFIAMKEKDHCHCNILPGIVGRLRCGICSSFAPRPMFLFQALDPLSLRPLPPHARGCDVYHALDAGESLKTSVFPGEHLLGRPPTVALGDFLTRQFDCLDRHEALTRTSGCFPTPTAVCPPGQPMRSTPIAWPSNTGRPIEGNPALWDVFPPQVPAEALDKNVTRGDATNLASLRRF